MALLRGRAGAKMSLPALGTGRWEMDRCRALAAGPALSWALPVHDLTQTQVRWLSLVFQKRDAGSATCSLGTAPSSRTGLGVPGLAPLLLGGAGLLGFSRELGPGQASGRACFQAQRLVSRVTLTGRGLLPESPLVLGAVGMLLGAQRVVTFSWV